MECCGIFYCPITSSPCYVYCANILWDNVFEDGTKHCIKEKICVLSGESALNFLRCNIFLEITALISWNLTRTCVNREIYGSWFDKWTRSLLLGRGFEVSGRGLTMRIDKSSLPPPFPVPRNRRSVPADFLSTVLDLYVRYVWSLYG